MESSPSAGQRVTVLRDGLLRAVGMRFGRVVAYDWGFEQNGRAWEQRSFVLMDEGFQINQPVIFGEEQRGWWYCDLVTIVDDGDTVRVDDMKIDVIVGPANEPYRVLDLHDYADAMSDGRLSPAEAGAGLRKTQSFLDRRLNRRDTVTRSWPDFPPAEVEELLSVELPQEWELIDVR